MSDHLKKKAYATTRIQLDFTRERVEEIDRLQRQTGMATRKQFIEQALLLFNWALRESAQGRVIGSIDPERDGYREVVMPALNHFNHANQKDQKEDSPA